jgi:hypothetical protein
VLGSIFYLVGSVVIRIIGLDPIGGETAPSDGAVQKVLLPEAAGSASRDLREGLWYRFTPSIPLHSAILFSLFSASECPSNCVIPELLASRSCGIAHLFLVILCGNLGFVSSFVGVAWHFETVHCEKFVELWCFFGLSLLKFLLGCVFFPPLVFSKWLSKCWASSFLLVEICSNFL